MSVRRKGERRPVYSPAAFVGAENFLQMLRKYRGILTRQEMHTLRGQALKGDVDAAIKGLKTLLEMER